MVMQYLKPTQFRSELLIEACCPIYFIQGGCSWCTMETGHRILRSLSGTLTAVEMPVGWAAAAAADYAAFDSAASAAA